MIVIRRPLMSEKSLQLAKSGLYTFLVEKTARKGEIKSTVKKYLGVDVVSIKIANFKKVSKLQRNRRGMTDVPGYKKALVKVKKGQKIDLFEAETKKEAEVNSASEPEVKEKKGLIRRTKVKIEKKEGKA